MIATNIACGKAKRLFSPYLDGMVSGAQMHALQAHMRQCDACRRDYQLLRQTQTLLASSLGRSARPDPPADLGLKLRLAISREAAARKRPFEGFRVRLANRLNAVMVPATAGLVSALVIFALALAVVGLPTPLRAGNSDVPLMLSTAPELQPSAFGLTMNSINADSLVVETYVDSNGRIDDYRILSEGGDAQQILPEVKRMLIFTTFHPAMYMGRPISGRAVLSFSKINVRG
jgi:hypothetical protein